jgi:D-alanyl-D-alanine carboxypeptidase/D-alanyl-D-alanine-endopeptidase (penicillin-binding protein 4)
MGGVLVLSLVLAGLAVTQTARIGQLFGVPVPSWRPAAAPSAPPAVLAAGAAGAPDAAAVTATVGPLTAAAVLGPHVTVSVVDVATGQPLYTREADSLTLPASTAKLLTAAAVLATRGPSHRLATRVVAGAAPGEVVLVGGGDPTLSGGRTGAYPDAARLPDLADQVRRSLGGTAPTRVTLDTSLFTGDVYGPGWDPDIPTSTAATKIMALTSDGARVNPTAPDRFPRRQADPDLAAGRAFAVALGLPASAVVRGGPAPADARQLGSVQSPPMARLVEIMLTESDNLLAEALARQVALARQQPASFEGGAKATAAVLGQLGLPVGELILADGSGLSRTNRVTASLLTDVLALAARPDHPELRAVYSGMPVAAYSGTLRDRYRAAAAGRPGAGLVRAKTGTLSRVSTLAGVAVTAQGRRVAFAVLADELPQGNEPAQEVLDRIAAALATLP